MTLKLIKKINQNSRIYLISDTELKVNTGKHNKALSRLDQIIKYLSSKLNCSYVLASKLIDRWIKLDDKVRECIYDK